MLTRPTPRHVRAGWTDSTTRALSPLPLAVPSLYPLSREGKKKTLSRKPLKPSSISDTRASDSKRAAASASPPSSGWSSCHAARRSPWWQWGRQRLDPEQAVMSAVNPSAGETQAADLQPPAGEPQPSFSIPWYTVSRRFSDVISCAKSTALRRGLLQPYNAGRGGPSSGGGAASGAQPRGGGMVETARQRGDVTILRSYPPFAAILPF